MKRRKQSLNVAQDIQLRSMILRPTYSSLIGNYHYISQRLKEQPMPKHFRVTVNGVDCLVISLMIGNTEDES